MKLAPNLWLSVLAIGATLTLIAGPASAQQIEGQVVGAGAPIANAKVTLFAATSDAPAQLSQTQSGPDGHFTLPSTRVPGGEIILYLVGVKSRPHHLRFSPQKMEASPCRHPAMLCRTSPS